MYKINKSPMGRINKGHMGGPYQSFGSRKWKEYLKKIRRLIIKKYRPSIKMVQFLHNLGAIGSSVEQPGSLNQSYIYQYNKSNKYRFYKQLNRLELILNYFFNTFYGLISKPVFLFTQNKLVLYVNYYIPNFNLYRSKKLVSRNIWKYNKTPARSAIQLKLELSDLIKVISKIFNGIKVEIQLNQLKYPYHDSTILSKLIALNTNKKRFRRIFNTIIDKASVITKDIILNHKAHKAHKDSFIAESDRKKIEIHNTIPAVLTGIKVQISGRLITQRQVPKRTVQKREIGGFYKTKDSIVDYAIYTNKNKKGAYSVKVWTTSKICFPTESE